MNIRIAFIIIHQIIATDMAFLSIVKNALLEKAMLLLDLYEKMKGVSCLLISAALLLLLTIWYPNIRRKFPKKVNCWFCCNFTKVPYEYSNSWDCPHCKQYNGFNKDGGYNKIIKAHYNAELNESIFNLLKNSNYNVTKNYSSLSNGFCKLCNTNQQLKVQQLALFVPFNEKNYDEEIEEYRLKLENAYKLCINCEKILSETLRRQEYILLQNQLNVMGQKPHIVQMTQKKKSVLLKYMSILFHFRNNCIKLIRWLSWGLSFLLLIALIMQLETKNEFSRFLFSYFVQIKSVYLLFKVTSTYINEIHLLGKEISLGGFFFSLLTISVQKERKFDFVPIAVWGLLHVLFWTKFLGIQTLVCAILLFINGKSLQKKNIHLSKNLLTKGLGEDKRYDDKRGQILRENISGKELLKDEIQYENTFTFQKKKQNVMTEKNSYHIQEKRQYENDNINSTEKDFEDLIVKKSKNQFETELLPRNECEGLDVPVNYKINASSTSAFNKSFLASLEVDKNERKLSPSLDEVHSHLSGLNLGRQQNNNKKPPNFLFENHNFSEKKTISSSSVIKPAKFIKNLSNSWTCADSNESISRSSTPSSGYSSQKPYQNRIEFTKTMSPISLNPMGRHDYYEYFDGTSRFCNFNCLAHGCGPYQQFPGHMGHSTVYTYTRPTNFSFPFSPQGFSNCKYSPSPRLSDISDTENLFQNASVSFEANRKWFKLKTISYYFSLSLNCLTLLIFIYFFFTGTISIEWSLPRINLFL